MADVRRFANWVTAAVLLTGTALALGGCGGGGGSDEAPRATPSGPDPLAGATVEQRLSLAARDIAFDQEELRGPVHNVIEIALVNKGALAHDFTIDELPGEVGNAGRASGPDHDAHGADEDSVHVVLERGDEKRLLVRVSEPGRYEFYCSVPGHRQGGMEGTLVVE